MARNHKTHPITPGDRRGVGRDRRAHDRAPGRRSPSSLVARSDPHLRPRSSVRGESRDRDTGRRGRRRGGHPRLDGTAAHAYRRAARASDSASPGRTLARHRTAPRSGLCDQLPRDLRCDRCSRDARATDTGSDASSASFCTPPIGSARRQPSSRNGCKCRTAPGAPRGRRSRIRPPARLPHPGADSQGANS